MQKGKDYIGVGVGAIILDKNGKVLLIRRGPKANNEIGMWGVPGGAVEYGETLDDTVKREIFEELGIRIKPLKILSMMNHLIKKDKQHWVTASFVCQLKNGKPQIREDGKIDEIKWFSINDISKLKKVSPTAVQALKEFKERYSEIEDMF